METKLIFLLSLTFLFLFGCSSVVLADDFQEGVSAIEKGDYKEAHKLWLSVAEQGDASAQFNLGLMYGNGKGVPQDYKEALRWNKLAAEQGIDKAQYNLGVMHAKGQGVPQDSVSAHMWWNICSAYECNVVEQGMSPSQIEKAEEMARNWKPKK